MRTQTPTPPLDVTAVEMTRYGAPQHETAATLPDSLYGPPQHESEPEDPEWLISIAAGAFSTAVTESAGSSVVDTESESRLRSKSKSESKSESTERELTVVRL